MLFWNGSLQNYLVINCYSLNILQFYAIASCTFCICPGNVAITHYSDVIMSAMAPHITSLTIVYSTIYLDGDQRKHQSSASLTFVRGIHRWPVNSPHKGPVTRKMLPFDDVFMRTLAHVMCFLHVCSRLWVRILLTAKHFSAGMRYICVSQYPYKLGMINVLFWWWCWYHSLNKHTMGRCPHPITQLCEPECGWYALTQW